MKHLAQGLAENWCSQDSHAGVPDSAARVGSWMFTVAYPSQPRVLNLLDFASISKWPHIKSNKSDIQLCMGLFLLFPFAEAKGAARGRSEPLIFYNYLFIK